MPRFLGMVGRWRANNFAFSLISDRDSLPLECFGAENGSPNIHYKTINRFRRKPMNQPVFNLHKLNQELISANTKIIHLNAKIAHLNQALGLCSAQLGSSEKRVEQLKEALHSVLDASFVVEDVDECVVDGQVVREAREVLGDLED